MKTADELQLVFWVSGGWKAMSFGWAVAGQPQFSHNCVLHSFG